MAAKLYQFLGSPFCAKVRKLLAFKGVEFEVVEVDYLERKELLLASGQITVPAVTLDSGETIVDSARIAMRLEELYPEPTIFPAGWRGMHVVLADYIDNHLEESVYPRRARRRARVLQQARCGSRRAVASDSRAQVRRRLRRSNDRGRNRPTGSAFVLRWRRSRSNSAIAPFLTGRIGLADFALYGQLYYLAFTGELKIPADMKNLRAFFGRVDRISSMVEESTPRR